MISLLTELESVKHPVHFVKNDNEGQKLPSSFIPFCEFGGNMSAMGVMIDEFDVPVCNSFLAKILNDQLCYEVDLNRFSSKNNIEKELELGFVFIMDYNEDRQVELQQGEDSQEDFNFVSRIDKSDYNQHAIIYLNTIGIFAR